MPKPEGAGDDFNGGGNFNGGGDVNGGGYVDPGQPPRDHGAPPGAGRLLSQSRDGPASRGDRPMRTTGVDGSSPPRGGRPPSRDESNCVCVLLPTVLL